MSVKGLPVLNVVCCLFGNNKRYYLGFDSLYSSIKREYGCRVQFIVAVDNTNYNRIHTKYNENIQLVNMSDSMYKGESRTIWRLEILSQFPNGSGWYVCTDVDARDQTNCMKWIQYCFRIVDANNSQDLIVFNPLFERSWYTGHFILTDFCYVLYRASPVTLSIWRDTFITLRDKYKYVLQSRIEMGKLVCTNNHITYNEDFCNAAKNRSKSYGVDEIILTEYIYKMSAFVSTNPVVQNIFSNIHRPLRQCVIKSLSRRLQTVHSKLIIGQGYSA